jgi:hypothetical protein
VLQDKANTSVIGDEPRAGDDSPRDRQSGYTGPPASVLDVIRTHALPRDVREHATICHLAAIGVPHAGSRRTQAGPVSSAAMNTSITPLFSLT